MRTAVAFLGALVLAGCGLTSSPADNLTFAPPPGWQASPGIMGYMQFWKSPTSRTELLMLFKSPKPIDQNDMFTSAKVNDAQVLRRESIHICGNQPAQYALAQGSAKSDAGDNDTGSATKSDADVQIVTTEVNGTTYMAVYVYPANQQPNPQAVAASRQLCAK